LASANQDIDIHDNGLVTLAGFPNVTDIVGNLNIVNNIALQTVAGFGKLGQIGGSLNVRDSDVLTQFDGLHSLVNIGGNLFVVSNPLLAGISGLRSGTLKSGALGGTYDIAGNPLLNACEVSAHKSTLNVATYNDQSGANLGCTACSGATCTGTPGGIAGQSGTFTGDAIVAKQADLDWLKNVVNLTGSLHIDSSSLNAVTGLTNLKSIGADFTLNSNATITNVGGLTGLQSINGSLSIQSNANLTNLAGLSSLAGVAGNFYLYNNGALGNVGGLANLATVGGYLNIQSCGALTTLDGLLNLTSVGGYLQIYGNPALTSMLNLIKPTGKLSALGGYLTVQSNGALSSCQPDALKAVLVSAQGWNKAYTQSGNLTCTKTCTAGGICQ